MTITPEAREAAEMELRKYSMHGYYTSCGVGTSVQLAINAAVAEKVAEIERLKAEVEAFKANNRYQRGYSAGEKESQDEIGRLLTENEKLRFEVTEIRRVVCDRYPDALMWDALHNYKQQLTELREISEKLATFETADEHMLYSALLEQWKEKNEK